MSNSLSAQIIINISPNPEQGRIDYSISTHDGESAGINQLADLLKQNLIQSLPQCVKPLGVTE
ncbi:hypothetical protein [Vibrio scophthalmi]|uniref:Uncharacterized protein n=1 Tax=Vibrio scophthalmi TaxID=45658 RepID=A0A1E3WMF5_9VIBR|nr:hypothetical protein [Vibrio scophthalmi]ODS10954.1 hypothetical protein VSF3289_01215 [Vibrio scophthalmi]